MLPLFNRTWVALNLHNKIYKRPNILDVMFTFEGASQANDAVTSILFVLRMSLK